ncbi:MAG: hypothetical protein VB067_02285 [Christensenellaceae bacterium]|nr:hypothetical protein [Christensenellaceae bacterium]
MEYRIDRFQGLSQAGDDLIMPGGCAPEAENVSTADGRLSVARGFRRPAAPPLAGGIGTLAAFHQRREGETVRRLVAVNKEGVWELTEAGWQARYLGAGAERASALNYQKAGADILLLADGVRPVLKWDGGAQMEPLPGCPHPFGQLTLNYERVWGSAVANEPDAVYWSRAFNPEDWSGDAERPDAGGGTVLIPTWNGGRVKALKTFLGDVLVFKDEDLFRIVGTYPGNYEVVRVHGVVGPVAPMSIAWTAGACYFLGEDGLCAYDGVTAQLVGGGEAKRLYERVNRPSAQGAVSALYKGRLHLALPLDGATHNNALLEVDLARGQYLLKTGFTVNCFLALDDALLMADADGRLHVYGAGDSYAGAKIDAFWRGPWQQMGAGAGRFTQLNMFASGAMDITLETDRSRMTRRVMLGERMRPACVPLSGSGRRFRLTIRNIDGGRFAVAPGLTISAERDD